MVEDGDSGDASGFAVLTDEDVARCLASVSNMQHRAIFQIMVDTGMSLGEIIGDEEIGNPGIYIQNINSDTLTIEVTYRFRNDDRYATRLVEIDPATLVTIQSLLVTQSRSLRHAGNLFGIGARRVRQFLVELDRRMNLGCKISVDTLRRTAMCKMLKAGLKPDEVRRRMGFIREREQAVLGAMTYILMDESYFENIIRQSVVNSVMQVYPTSDTVDCSGFSGMSASGEFER